MPRVLFCEGDELPARTALRDVNPAVRKCLFDQLPIWKVERKEDLPRLLLHSDIAAREKHRHHVGIFFAVDVRQEALFPGQELAASDPKNRHAGVIAITRVSDDIAISALDLEHHRRLS